MIIRPKLFRFQPETMRLQSAILVAGGGPSSARLLQMDKLIASLKRTGVWPKLDALYIFANSDSASALINWKNPGTFNAVFGVTPTFAVDRGFTGDSSTMYMTTSFNPLTAGGQYAQDSGSFGGRILVRAFTSFSSYVASDIGNRLGFTNFSDVPYFSVNIGNAVIGSSQSPAIGLYINSRTSSSLTTLYKDGVSINTDATASSAIVNKAFEILREAGRNTDYSGDQVASIFIGGGLTASDVVAFNAAELAYMQAVGAA